MQRGLQREDLPKKTTEGSGVSCVEEFDVNIRSIARITFDLDFAFVEFSKDPFALREA